MWAALTPSTRLSFAEWAIWGGCAVKKMMASPVAGVRVGLAIGASVLALSVAQPAVAQLCANGSEGPMCLIDNSGSTGSITGTIGTLTVVTNSGTITGAPAIGQGGSFLLSVTNAADGVIDGNGSAAIVGAPSLGFLIVNAGTINGNVVFNDQPAPNIWSYETEEDEQYEKPSFLRRLGGRKKKADKGEPDDKK